MKKVNSAKITTEVVTKYRYIANITENIMLPARNGYPEVNINNERHISRTDTDTWYDSVRDAEFSHRDTYIYSRNGELFNDKGRFVKENMVHKKGEEPVKYSEVVSYWHKKDIEIYLNALPTSELLSIFNYGDMEPVTALEKIDMYVSNIINYDNGIQNHTSEIDKCRKYALEILAIYNEILNLIEEITEPDAKMCIRVLKRLDYYWLRVLGDQLTYLDGLEDTMKNLHRNENLCVKAAKHYIKEKLVKCEDNRNIAYYVSNVD